MASKAKYSGIVQGRIEHGVGFVQHELADGTKVRVPDIQIFNHGDVFETDDEKLWNELRAAHAVKLPSELAPAAAAAIEAQAEELDAAQRRIAELEAALKAQVANKAPSKKSPE